MPDLKWEPGLVAFIKDKSRLSACIRTPDNQYNLVFSEGSFRSRTTPWDAMGGIWDEDPVLWVGSQAEWDTLRALSKTPAELIENATALTAGKQATQASGDATILDFLESCGISAPDLEEARKIVIHNLDETRELRSKLDQEREAHKQCSDALRSANKRADDAEDKIARIRLLADPDQGVDAVDDNLVDGGFYRDGEGGLWYHSEGDADYLCDVDLGKWMPPPSRLTLVGVGFPGKENAGDIQDMAAVMRLAPKV